MQHALPQNVLVKVLQQRHTRVAGTFLEGKRAHAGGCRTGARHRKRIRIAPLPGRITAGRVALPDGGPPACQNVRKKLDAACIDAVPGSKGRQIGAVATRNNLGTGTGRSCTDACAAGNGT